MGPCPAPQACRALSLGKQVGKVVHLQTCSIHVEKRKELSLRGIRGRAVRTWPGSFVLHLGQRHVSESINLRLPAPA